MMAASVPGIAAAQQAQAQPAQKDSLDEIVVTGYAISLEKAIQNKRDADVISDGISAEDIGKYPEQNIAESLQRVTGVQITRSLGDGQYLSVRGLDPKFTDTLYNGRQLPSGSGTRAFDFQVLSSNFASQVDVYKSPTADMLESGLAATVNVQSIRPLTVGGERAAITAEGVYDEQARAGVKPHLSGLYTNTFMDNRLGWTVSVDLNERRIDDQQASSDGVLPDSSYTGAGTAYRLFSMHLNDLVGTDKRVSATSMLQFKVNDALELRLDTIASKFEQRYQYFQGQNFYMGAGALGPSPTASETFDANNVETVWSGSNVFAWMQANSFDYIQTMTSTALAGTLTLRDWTIDSEVSFGQAREETTQMYVSWATPSPGGSLTYNTTVDPGGPVNRVFTNGFDPNNPNNYAFNNVQGAYNEPTTDRIWTGKIDAAHPIGFGWIKDVKVGVNYEDRTLANTPNFIGAFGGGFPANMNQYLMMDNNPNFFSSYGGGANIPRNFLTVNLNKFFTAFPLSTLAAEHPPVQSLTTTTMVEEKSESAYARIDLTSADGRWKGNAGLRAVHTEELSSGYVPTPDANLVYGLFGGANSLSYSAAAIQAQSQSYSNLLPSFNLAYTIADDLVTRLAVARVMQRPDMNLLAAASSPNASTGPPPSGAWIGTLAKGNPALQPYLSNQFDVSLEWYFGKRSILAADFFLKDVKNMVLTNYTKETDNVTLAGSQTSTFPSGTVLPINFAVSEPVNAQATTIKGVEFDYQQPFEFLPGPLRALGAQANYTHIWSGDVVLNQGQPALPLTGVSSNTYNLGAYYDNSRVDVHAVYNYRSQWVQDPLSYFGDGIFVKGYGQLDLSANYNVNSSLSINASVVNLTESPLIQVDKYNINRLYELSGRRFYLGVHVKL